MLEIRPYRQSTGYCGPASLKMVLDFYGVRASEKTLARLSGAVRSKGTSADGLVNAAKHLGFDVLIKDHATLSDIKRFIRKGVPVIVDWFSTDDGHYSVVVDMDEKTISLQDPELGALRSIDQRTFRRIWFDFPGGYLRSKNDLVLRRMIAVTPKET